MKKMENSTLEAPSPLSLQMRMGLVVLVLLTAAAVVAPLGYLFSGIPGVTAAMVALCICLAAGLLALAVSHPFGSPDFVLTQMLLSMVIRMAVPLAMCVLIYLKRGPLLDAGLAYYLLVFYGLTLAIETILLTRGQRHRQANASS